MLLQVAGSAERSGLGNRYGSERVGMNALVWDGQRNTNVG